jgi:HSP20 family protein
MNSLIRRKPSRADESAELMRPFRSEGRNMLALDVHETDAEFIVTTALPGAKPDDIQVKIQGNLLTIRSESSGSSSGEHVQRQFHSSYERSIRLPHPIDSEKVAAEYENGELRLTLPKATVSEGHSIPIRSANQTVPVKAG